MELSQTQSANPRLWEWEWEGWRERRSQAGPSVCHKRDGAPRPDSMTDRVTCRSLGAQGRDWAQLCPFPTDAKPGQGTRSFVQDHGVN
jgi:hypothetical protein